MNVDNPKLQAIQRQKAELKKQMRDCYDLGKLLSLDEQYNVLDEEETRILKNCDVIT